MVSRAMVVVAGGSGERFGSDKLAAGIRGRALVQHTVAAVVPFVDRCILVGRPDTVTWLRSLQLDVEVVPGGPTRTLSEMAGLAALGQPPDLIGIHDGVRPLVTRDLIETVFQAASETGGAVPLVRPEELIIQRSTLRPVPDLLLAQTPQVFRGPQLMAAYVGAAQSGFEGRDTAEVVERFGALDIAVVAGDPGNVKVTYPADLEEVRRRLRAPSHNGPR